ncbi:UDP-3-O-acyl-N-acetylglucosamine deacetylase [Tychonema sp. LEGE 07199]|uniref:UDP-3-O-acyl-N-acetylglucosamine deacetylase n=1 Tax=unclassified Tychonema TaxID=2642144 RepID=UPI00187F9586|nr:MULTISPECIES: UDP-3-O-acyl-N-acetylglucosamine deacetylase [unclassified Tychonema]MBE9119585.1 UDP-3-O-acyl-N-acetylglucosamine deacetylase [Tychonema sp. LEGE 07199]MBE9131789.1 UDP-3-O-acyl-N-acetylglucosamine deacetylase [Tychonema sp. LEGE 07196]
MTQSTLKSEFELSGIGLHSGEQTRVRVLPAAVGEGRYFVRIDLSADRRIPAKVEAVCQTALSTELANAAGDRIRTVEHLLGALAGMGADNARIEVDGPELPLLDGSAEVWVEAIARTGLVSQECQEYPTASFALAEPIWVRRGDAFVAALPSAQTRFSYGIDFEEEAIGNQWYSWSPEVESFATAIAPARTFGLARQVDQLRQAGLIKGGTLDNALVCDRSGWLNPPLRFANEPVRHKILDLVGDLSLLGTWPKAHYLAYKASHNLHVQLAQTLKSQTLAVLETS